MREAGVAKTAVWRWQERFTQEGVDGLLRDKTRPSRIPPLAPEIAERVPAGAHFNRQSMESRSGNYARSTRSTKCRD